MKRPWPSRPRRKRLLAAVALLAHLAGAIGLPLPARTPPAGGEEARPAEVSRCGCPVGDRQRGCCCCSQGGGCCGGQAESDPVPEGEEGVRWSAGLWASRCQGDTPGWLLFSVPVVPTGAVCWCLCPTPLGWVIPADEVAARLALPLPEPPPRPLPA